jgi:uridine kinase
MNTIFIGIAGGTGSGKTTLTEHLVSRFGDDIAVVHHDNYYKRQDCSFEERCKQNYDHPDAFDTDLLDIKIFVETDADVRILRRALRDVEERGRSMQSVVTQYLTTVKPMHEQFVEPTRKYADIVVLEGGHNLVALDLIMQRIANHIAEN